MSQAKFNRIPTFGDAELRSWPNSNWKTPRHSWLRHRSTSKSTELFFAALSQHGAHQVYGGGELRQMGDLTLPGPQSLAQGRPSTAQQSFRTSTFRIQRATSSN
ncbi:unnamed protein product [Ostreobium quekettii]|uniref:Uncharacterized protein n=1 Tax=Ostreobium quekettii TaxID=121088 RepID=A0A8S1J1T4_9CHLO|nr:unnamed protein product [Ostreobium quekettii]